MPERFVAESLLEAFPAPATARTDRVLLARAETARDVLPDGLAAMGYAVDVLGRVPHGRRPSATDPDSCAAATVDAITFTSSSTVDNFCDAVGPFAGPQPAVISIGPVTSDTARARGLQVDVEADPHTIDGLVDALVQLLGQ